MPKPLANFFVMDVISCLKFAKKNESFCWDLLSDRVALDKSIYIN